MLSKIAIAFFSMLIVSASLHAQPLFGQPAYEIALPTLKGDTLKLSSLKGKIVLIDFWASWCGPCRAANKDMVKVYNKFKDYNFEILGVSLDEAPKQWERAIAKDKIKWLQVIDTGGWDAHTVLQWNLYQIPTNYLINEEGIVIGKDLLVEDVERALHQLSGK
jgi:Peroxiredoxin